MWTLIFAVTALAAGLIQGVAGFGSGPVQMMVYTLRWPVPTAAAVSVCVSIPLNLNMLWTYRREVRWQKVLAPAIPYLILCSAAISFSTLVNQALMKKIFGAFLVALAIYNLFPSHREKRPLSTLQTVVYIAVSALCDAFFGIGGPLMVLYYLHKTETAQEYLGTVAAFFLLNGIFNTIYRLICGILTAEYVPCVGIGMAAVLLGVTIAHPLARRLNDAMLKTITYIMIGVSGMLNLFS